MIHIFSFDFFVLIFTGTGRLFNTSSNHPQCKHFPHNDRMCAYVCRQLIEIIFIQLHNNCSIASQPIILLFFHRICALFCVFHFTCPKTATLASAWRSPLALWFVSLLRWSVFSGQRDTSEECKCSLRVPRSPCLWLIISIYQRNLNETSTRIAPAMHTQRYGRCCQFVYTISASSICTLRSYLCFYLLTRTWSICVINIYNFTCL